MIVAPRPPDRKAIEEYVAKGYWGDTTFGDILERRAAEHPDREVFSDARRRLTYGQLWTEVRRCAALLERNGVRRGDVVTIQMVNRIEFPVVFFALELIGAIANKVSPDFRAMELEYILRFSGSSVYVCGAQFRGFDYVAMIQGIRPKLPQLRAVLCVDPTDHPDVVGIAEELKTAVPLAASERVRMSAIEPMRMCFTSGTTGNPKGVLHCFNTTLCASHLLNDEFRCTDREVFLVWLPVGLNWGYLTLVQAVMAGARAVLMERFSAEGALELIEKERASFIATAPASLVAILNSPSLQRRDLTSLRVVITGGASAAVETIKAFQAAVPSAKLIELYGMLETGFHTFTRLTDDPLKVNGTIGRCVPMMGLRIIDDQGKDVPYGEEGEIAAIGPSVHIGYLNNEAANRDSFTQDGWFRTGDLARYADAEGNVRIVGRKKEIINRGGKKFFPREVEELLYEHPKILQVAIVGVPDPRLGERSCMCAIPKQGTKLELSEFVSFLKGRVADYKLPEQLVVMDDFPMTPTGKLKRPDLVKRVVSGS